MPRADALKTDLYELTMAAGYYVHHRRARATFELYCHTLPDCRSFLVAAGLAPALDYILNLRFSAGDIRFLRAQPVMRGLPADFFQYLRYFRFSGNLWAVPEGEICFAGEPLLQVEAPIIEAQMLETYLLATMNLSTVVASKAARVVAAARRDGTERAVVDFGARRAHGPEAGIFAARAAFIGGCFGTSHVGAGKDFGIPIFGTMAHSWVQAFAQEQQAFASYQELFPRHTVLLVDTYDTLAGVRRAVALGREVRAVRLDSGNLGVLSRRVRAELDRCGRPEIKIVASGNLDEYQIDQLVRSRAPIDIFGVGTELVAPSDAPTLDLTYKLVETSVPGKAPVYTAKFSPRKRTIPGRKQVCRQLAADGSFIRDQIRLAGEPAAGQVLLRQYLRSGRLAGTLPTASESRDYAAERLACLPKRLWDIHQRRVYPVACSPRLLALSEQVRSRG